MSQVHDPVNERLPAGKRATPGLQPVFVVYAGAIAVIGVRILGSVDFKENRYNGMVVAISPGMGMIPLVAPDFKRWMPPAIHPLTDSGILLASLAAVSLNMSFNGSGSGSESDARDAALAAEGSH